MNDEKLKLISEMDKLENLQLWYMPVSDAGLESLSSMLGLRQLQLGGTHITESGIEKLMRARPDIKLYPGLNVRMIWIPQEEEVSSIIVHQADGTWHEQMQTGNGFQFAESERNEQYIELVDSSRDLRIRLFDDRAEMRVGDAPFSKWKGGGWREPLQIPQGFSITATANE